MLLYLIDKGIYFALIDDFKRTKIDEKLKNYIEDDVNKALSEYQENIRLINDGGNLTSKRKDIFLKTIYFLESRSNSDSKNFKMICRYSKLKTRNNMYYYIIGIIIFTLFYVILTVEKINNVLIIIILLIFLFVLLFYLLRNNSKKINILQKEIKQNFKCFYSDIKYIPNIYVKNKQKGEKKLIYFIFLATFIAILIIIPKEENGSKKQEEFIKIQNIYKKNILNRCYSKYKDYICECMILILNKEQNVYYSSYPGGKLQEFYKKINSGTPINKDDRYYKITFNGMLESCRKNVKNNSNK